LRGIHADGRRGRNIEVLGDRCVGYLPLFVVPRAAGNDRELSNPTPKRSRFVDIPTELFKTDLKRSGAADWTFHLPSPTRLTRPSRLQLHEQLQT
jgi:hypothetical protein